MFERTITRDVKTIELHTKKAIKDIHKKDIYHPEEMNHAMAKALNKLPLGWRPWRETLPGRILAKAGETLRPLVLVLKGNNCINKQIMERNSIIDIWIDL